MPTFSLNTLKASPHNVRKTGGASIEALAASIRHQGLINPITVTEDGAVVAGNRRLQAMQLLVKEGHLEDTHPVDCTVVGAEVATEISLAENVMREAMHPADEFEAFHRLVTKDGLTPAEIAERFGVTERHVQQRLRLANLAPVFIKLYRDGNATLEQLMALSVTDNAEVQLAAWESGEVHSYYRSPERLRDTLLDKEITSDDELPKFVGLDDYRAAGGKVREDLFTDTVVLLDAGLVNRLAQAKLQAEADKQLAKGWGWAEARVSWPYDERAKFKQSPGKTPAALLGVMVTLKGDKVEMVTGLTKPGAKAPKDAKPTGQPKQHQSAKANPLREAHEKLEGTRTGLVRRALRANPEIAMQALVAALAKDYFNISEDHLVETLICPDGIFPYMHSDQTRAIAALDTVGAKEADRWESLVKAGTKKHGSALAWLLQEPGHVATDLLEFLAVEAVTPEEGYLSEQPERMHQAIKLLGVDLTTEWQLTETWLQAQGKAYILAALEDAMGKAKAEPFGKLKADKLAVAALSALTDACWRPEPMRAPAPKAKTPAKKAAKKTTAQKGAKK